MVQVTQRSISRDDESLALNISCLNPASWAFAFFIIVSVSGQIHFHVQHETYASYDFATQLNHCCITTSSLCCGRGEILNVLLWCCDDNLGKIQSKLFFYTWTELNSSETHPILFLPVPTHACPFRHQHCKRRYPCCFRSMTFVENCYMVCVGWFIFWTKHWKY